MNGLDAWEDYQREVERPFEVTELERRVLEEEPVVGREKLAMALLYLTRCGRIDEFGEEYLEGVLDRLSRQIGVGGRLRRI